MNIIKIRKKDDNKVDLAIRAIKIYCLLYDIQINNTDSTVLAYFIIYGTSRDTRELILKSDVVSSDKILNNIVSSLRKRKLLIKEKIGSDSINSSLNFGNSAKLGLVIKLEI